MYKQRYADRRCPHHSMFVRLYKNLKFNGSFKIPKVRSKIDINPANTTAVLTLLSVNPNISLRAVAGTYKKKKMKS